MRKTVQLTAILATLALGIAWAQPSAARIDIFGLGTSGKVELVEKGAGLKASRCTWWKDEGKVNRSWSLNSKDLTTEWEELTFTIQSDTKMRALVLLRGRWAKAGQDGKQPQIEAWYDAITVEGSELGNPSFEDADEEGNLVSWEYRKFEGQGPKVVKDASKAKDGENFLAASMHRQATQKIDLRPGEPVKFSVWVRAAE